MLTTTFKLLRKNDACKDRYTVLRESLRGRGDDEPITMIEILDSNGLDDALWALRAVPDEQAAERDRLARLFACWCLRQVWHLLTDERSRTAIEVAERYAVGEATHDDLKAAARSAADAADAADADADYAAYAAARAAAAAAAAAYATYADAADAADADADYAAAYAAYAAYAAAAAANAAADAAAYAADAAYAAVRDAQAAKFREMFG